MAAIDLDGTLLGPDHQPTTANAAAVRGLVTEGVVCVVASGRMHEASAPYAEALGLSGPVISYNGALVVDTCSGETWQHLPVSADVSDEVVAFCATHCLHLNYYFGARVYVEKSTPWGDLYHRHTGSPMEVVGDLRAFQGCTPTKLILVDSPEKIDELLPLFRDRFAGRAYVTRSNPEYLEFMHVAANKGDALALVAARLGIARDHVAAFGDSDNDIPMLQWAGLGVAVGSPAPAVRCAAGLVVECPNNDSLAAAIAAIRASRGSRGKIDLGKSLQAVQTRPNRLLRDLPRLGRGQARGPDRRPLRG